MTKQLFFVSLLIVSTLVFADDKSDCETGLGSYVTGVVIGGPFYRQGYYRKNIELSHTRLFLSDESQQIYRVDIDNVFAAGYDRNVSDIPAPLNSIHRGDRLVLCGQVYRSPRVGIHWVHTNCGRRPSQAKPNGFIKKIDPVTAQMSDNYENNTAFCRLWP